MDKLITDFINKYTGVANVGDTDANKEQCVGLIEVWTDNLGLPHTWGNAIDLLSDADSKYFTIVYNKIGDTSQFPPDGAVVVLGKPYGLLPNGTYAGHTGISVDSNGNTLRLFEQNDPEGGTPQIKEYTYDACLGWMIPKIIIPTTILNTHGIDQTNTASVQVVYDTWYAVSQGEYISKANYDNKVNSLQATIDNLNQQINDRNNNITTLTSQVSTLNTQLVSVEQEVETLKPIASQIPQLKKELNQAEGDRSSCLVDKNILNKKIAGLQSALSQAKPKGFWNKLVFLFA